MPRRSAQDDAEVLSQNVAKVVMFFDGDLLIRSLTEDYDYKENAEEDHAR